MVCDITTTVQHKQRVAGAEEYVSMTNVQPLKPLILVVDDDRAMRMLLRRVMEQEGFRVAEAEDGSRCLEAYRELHPDMVLLDAVMPVMDGFEACARLKAEPNGFNTPVLIITSLDDSVSVNQAFAAGASDYVTKPIHWAVLRQRVRRLLRARQAEEGMRESERRLATLLSNLPGMAYRSASDASWSMEFVSEGAMALTGYHADALLASGGGLFATLINNDDLEKVQNDVQTALGQQRAYQLTYRIRCADGTEKWVWEQGRGVVAMDGTLVALEGFITDITERKLVEEQLAHQAFHDRLTNLPNRALFMDRLDHALARSARREHSVAVLFMDLDQFKMINDTLGHKAGDQLLLGVGMRLASCLRPGDTAARFGGDEFTLLLEDIDAIDDAIEVAERVAKQLTAPFSLEGHEIYVTTSIGIALSGSSHERPDDLLRNADMALYEAKYKGKNRYAVFDPRMNSRTWERLELESDLRRALEREEFALAYQPVVHLDTGVVVEVEALLRWNHPKRGLLLPAQFLPLAEETGLVIPIGAWVLRHACLQAKTWTDLDANGSGPVISVNLSRREFSHSRLVEAVAQALRETELDPRRLKLEIAEHVLIEHIESSLDMLRDLKSLGVQLAVDDFGTGYSALGSLKRFPVETLKIDRTFVQSLGRHAEDNAMVRAVIAFASALGMHIIAEGVETEAQARALRDLGCVYGQGFFLVNPLSGKALQHMLNGVTVYCDAPS
jgi:diguanylate cyclase (GGDEF)-like protein/PAS domain S-box-containing protein